MVIGPLAANFLKVGEAARRLLFLVDHVRAEIDRPSGAALCARAVVRHHQDERVVEVPDRGEILDAE
jgi:hypothetical protein